MHADRLLELLRGKEILASKFGTLMVRMVTHLDLNDEAIDRTLSVLRSIEP